MWNSRRAAGAMGAVAALAMMPVLAQLPVPEADLDAGRISKDPLRGLIINRTMTVIGWDFYRNFSTIWQALYPQSEVNLTVVERPTAQFGSEIWVRYMNQTVFHTFLSPARSRAREESKQAVEIAHNGVQNIEIQRKYVQDDDLGPEELR